MSQASLVAIADFCTTGSGGTPSRANSKYFGGDIPWVKSGELRESIILDTEEKITEIALRESSAKLIPSGSILLAMYGATVGRMALLGVDAATNQAVCSIRPDPIKADTQYIFHALQAKIDHFLSRAAGGAQPNISQGVIRETKILLPPLAEQKRVAGILDKADALRRKRKRALELLDGLTQSIFLEMFGDPSTNRNGFGRGTISDLLTETQYGTSAKAGSAGAYPILRMGNVTNSGRLDLEDLKWIDLPASERKKYTLRQGDIIFNRTNSAELVGKSAVFDRDEPYAFAGYLVRARAKTDTLPFYIVGYLNSAHGKATLRRMAKSIVGMANINAREMQSIPILIPDSHSVRRYAEAIAAVRMHEQRSQSLLGAAEALFSSLQHRAFTGQL